MKTITATFRSGDEAQTAVSALHDAGVQEGEVGIETSADGNTTIVSVTIDEGQLDAAASILKQGVSFETEERPVSEQQNIAGHPDGSRPIITPAVPNR